MAIPSDLRVHRPGTAEEALALLAEYGDECVPYAGGTELVLLLKVGLAEHRHLVDLKRIPGFADVAAPDGSPLRIGAAATHLDVLSAPVVATGWRSLATVEATVGNVRVQATGTVGGNLCFADPQSDPATYLVAAGATAGCLGAGGSTRLVPVAEFLTDAYTTSLREGQELLAWIDVPRVPAGTILAQRKVAFGERPDATCAVRLTVAGGQVTDARIVVGSVTPTPLVCVAAHGLDGLRLVDGADGRAGDGRYGRLVAEVARACAEEAGAIALSDRRGPHSRAVVSQLVERLLLDQLAALPSGADAQPGRADGGTTR